MGGVQRDKKRKEGENDKKTCHLFDAVFVLFLCCFYVAFVCHSLCSGVGGNSKKKETYTGRSLLI